MAIQICDDNYCEEIGINLTVQLFEHKYRLSRDIFIQ